MYLAQIELQNVGPIEVLRLDFPFTAGTPQPLILVGENGTGKSLVLAYIVSSLLSFKQTVYENVEVEKGKVYKVRSPVYIKSGSLFSYARLRFTNEISAGEWQLGQTRKQFEDLHGSTPNIKDWTRIKSDERECLWVEGLTADLVLAAFEKNTYLFFPPNRFEEPGWLNIFSLQEGPKFIDARRVSGWSERSVIAYSSLAKVKNWLLELVLDRSALELKFAKNQADEMIVLGSEGRATSILLAVDHICTVIFSVVGGARIGVGDRANRHIAIMSVASNHPIVSNIAALSTGESLLLFLFLAILMDYEMTNGAFNSTVDVKGIIVIDEIDLHLHARHLRDSLPKLMRLFPNIQFIITTHSPLFLLGMQQEYGDNGFQIVQMPSSERITTERFKEFGSAFNYFRETTAFDYEISEALKKDAAKPVLFVEGESDIMLVRTAWQKRRGGELPFVLSNGHGRSQIAVLFKDEDSLNKSKNRIIIGLWDFDEAYNDWNGVKFSIAIDDEVDGLTKKHAAFNRYAVLLPVPRQRAMLANKAYGIKSRMPIELLFSDAVLARSNNLSQEPVLGGTTVPSFQGDKTSFAERAALLDAGEFVNFDPLFTLIDRILAGTVQISSLR